MDIPSFSSAELDGRKHDIAYRQYGHRNPEGKLTVLCIHGLTRNSSDFHYLADALSSTGKYHVIAMDVVGRGESAWLSAESREYYGPELYARDVLNLLKHLGLEYVDFCLGTSMGGLIAFHVINLTADRPQPIIKHLILNDVAPLISTKGIKRIAGYSASQTGFPDLNAAKAEVKKLYSTLGEIPEDRWDFSVQNSFKFDEENKVYVRKFDPRIITGETEPWFKIFEKLVLKAYGLFDADVPLAALWKNVKVPTLLIRGAESDLVPPSAIEFMRKTWPNTELIEIEKVGHAPSLMIEHEIQKVMDWMEKQIRNEIKEEEKVEERRDEEETN